MAARKIVIAGGNGNLGRALSEWFSERGDVCIVLTRQSIQEIKGGDIQYRHWNVTDEKQWIGILEESDLLINVCGARLVGNSFKDFKDSRIIPTTALTNAINNCINPPKVFISASSVNFYPSERNSSFTEESVAGNSKYSVLCKEWEEAAKGISTNKSSVYIARIGSVVTPDSIYTSFAELLSKGLIFNLEDFYINYISSNDFCNAIDFISKSAAPTYSAFNICNKQAILYSDLIEVLKRAYHKTRLVRIPEPISSMAFTIKGLDPSFFKESRQVEPESLLSLGFTFSDNDLEKELKKLLTNDGYK